MDRLVTISEDDVWAAVDRERLDLADLFSGLDEQAWTRPSLCAGWTVRDVAAHLALAHLSAGQVAVALVRAGGSVDRMVHDTARRHAVLPTGVLVEQLRAMVGSRRLAPGITPLEPLVDVLVHGQDVAIPLGIDRPVPVVAAAAAATRVWTYRWPLSRTFDARRRLAGLELVATDTAWSAGAGERVEGPVGALLLLLTGRRADLGRLTGAGAARLSP